MYNDDNSVTIVFNGKIYNFGAVGTELEALGHGFLNNVDTETIIHGWKEWGPDCVRRLSGMFAFALWDRNSEMLFWARDRLGTKPLYYSHSAARVVFGSEMHALAVVPGMCRKIRPQAVDDFFAYGYLPEPEAIFVDLKNCRQAARSSMPASMAACLAWSASACR